MAVRGKKNEIKKEKTVVEAEIAEQPITRTLEENYMPYSMSVIISRAIPEIDGFKPAHRKLLYTMYKMGLMTGQRTKSANVVGQTMRLNPHGDASIYETLVRLTRGNEALLHPFVDSKGSFGKQYSKMAFAAPRYTEVKLDPICAEIFGGIDKEAVDFRDNYDGTMKEPALLPTAFPNLLVSANSGIAVGMASNICSFNLGEVCDAAIEVIKNGPDTDLTEILKAPDFSTGGYIMYDRGQIEQIYRLGTGSVRIRARYSFVKSDNLIEITEIPYTTNTEAIVDRLAELIKAGRLKEISDVRDETDKNGLKLTIDLKRGTDPDRLMKRLYKLTTLEDSFKCNFNVLIAGTPHLMGVGTMLDEWHYYRAECLSRELFFDLKKKEERLHLLEGLKLILLDIDKAIAIIRNTKNDIEVVPNLAEGFGIDEVQAEYIADIRLRNLNKDYILKQTADIEKLKEEIAETEAIIKSRRRMDNLIIKQLEQIKKKYAIPRKSEIIYEEDAEEDVSEPVTEDFPVYAFITREGYFKRILPASLRGSDVQKTKEDDEMLLFEKLSDKTEILVFTSLCQCYKTRMSDFENTKASALGDFLATKLEFESGEKFVFAVPTLDYSEKIFLLFENGKSVIIPVEAYRTKTNRKKLTAAFSDASPVVSALILKEDKCEIYIRTAAGRELIIPSDLVPVKQTRSGNGVQTVALRKNDVPVFAKICEKGEFPDKTRKRKIPSPGDLSQK